MFDLHSRIYRNNFFIPLCEFNAHCVKLFKLNSKFKLCFFNFFFLHICNTHLASDRELAFCLSSSQAQESFSAVAVVATATTKVKRAPLIARYVRSKQNRETRLSQSPWSTKREKDTRARVLEVRLNESESESRVYICIAGR